MIDTHSHFIFIRLYIYYGSFLNIREIDKEIQKDRGFRNREKRKKET